MKRKAVETATMRGRKAKITWRKEEARRRVGGEDKEGIKQWRKQRKGDENGDDEERSREAR